MVLDKFLELFKEQELLRNLLSTAMLIAVLLVLRYIAVRSVNRSKIDKTENKRKWLVQINNVTTILLCLGLVVVWAAKLQAFAISIVALAAAIVIATKELILCFMGGVFNTINRTFKIGDRIEIGVFRGEVIDHNFFKTEVLEIGPGKLNQYTGKTVEIPNSLFLSNGVIKEERASNYRLHSFSVFLPLDADIAQHKKWLKSAAKSTCQEYLSLAKDYVVEVQKKEGLEAPSVEPRVSVSLQNKEHAELIARVPVPSLRAARIEQDILDKYIDSRRENLNAIG